MNAECYETLLKVFILPCKKSLETKYQSQKDELTKYIENIPLIIDRYRKMYNITEKIEGIISKSCIFLFILNHLIRYINDSYENFLYSIVKTLINSEINQKYNLNCKVRNRINVAGVTIKNATLCPILKSAHPL